MFSQFAVHNLAAFWTSWFKIAPSNDRLKCGSGVICSAKLLSNGNAMDAPQMFCDQKRVFVHAKLGSCSFHDKHKKLD